MKTQTEHSMNLTALNFAAGLATCGYACAADAIHSASNLSGEFPLANQNYFSQNEECRINERERLARSLV